ncbi:hypothetical protein NLI96_g4580 [Meripilus lineatus]|uniref:Fungal-type protein kinase domain-containing protein n=1 Tax=Meripilus lineatus TaxID=2056292 RepID=A0AAD5V4L8_9APHY|nr:hypothetical protein NLI96_g4580 [Physisporinus lineatus]
MQLLILDQARVFSTLSLARDGGPMLDEIADQNQSVINIPQRRIGEHPTCNDTTIGNHIPTAIDIIPLNTISFQRSRSLVRRRSENLYLVDFSTSIGSADDTTISLYPTVEHAIFEFNGSRSLGLTSEGALIEEKGRNKSHDQGSSYSLDLDSRRLWLPPNRTNKQTSNYHFHKNPLDQATAQTGFNDRLLQVILPPQCWVEHSAVSSTSSRSKLSKSNVTTASERVQYTENGSLLWKYHSTADSWTTPSGRFGTSEKEFSGAEVAHTFHKLIDGMQSHLETGGLVGRITTGHPSTTSSTSIIDSNGAKHSNPKVDLSIFESSGRNSEGLVSECDLTEAEKEASTSPYKHYLARAEWDRIVVPITVESSTRACAFEPVGAETQSPEAETMGSGTISGKITRPVGKIFEHQHRSFVYSIYIHGGRVFLIRWDRLGAVVSEPFSLIEEPHRLLGFLFRLAKMNPAQRGYDTSIRPASKTEAKEFTAFSPVDSIPKTYLQDALRSDGDKKAAIFRVDLRGLESSDPTAQLVFARPRVLGKGVEGRATRGYIAYDLVNKRLVFLKDSWQPETKSCHLELDTFKRLQSKNVSYVATPVGGGYVASGSCQPKGSSSLQRTLSQVYLSAAHGEYYRARVHYRFAVQEIGRPLGDYKDAKQMVLAVCCALSAHKAAWEKAGILHGDVSPGNILITEDGRGILNDWDMCKREEEGANVPSPAFRSVRIPEHTRFNFANSINLQGTWPFMSALLLCCPENLMKFQMTWNRVALRTYDEYHRTEAGFDVGGTLKLASLKQGDPGLGFVTADVRPAALRALVTEMMTMCKEHYSSPDVVDQLTTSGVDFREEPCEAPQTSHADEDDLLPYFPGCQPREIEFPEAVTPASNASKPLMNDHKAISEILLGALKVSPRHWTGVKYEDQFLKRPAQVDSDSDCGTASGVATVQKQSQSRLRSAQNHNDASTHPKRGLASSEEFETQERSKRVKRSGEGGLVAEGNA